MQATAILGLALSLGLTLGPAMAQAPKDDPEIAQRIETVESAVSDRKMEHDAEAVDALGVLAASYDSASDKDRQRILRTADAVLSRGPLRPPERSAIYEAAAQALAAMGQPGARSLQRTYERKRFPTKPEWKEMHATLVRSIGRTGDPGAVDFLLERAERDTEAEILAAAGEALGQYAGADEKVRKEIAKTMIAKLGGLEGTASIAVMRADTPQSLAIEDAKRTLAAISEPWNATLAKLTGQTFTKAFDWNQWWNDNKGKRWPEPATDPSDEKKEGGEKKRG